VNHFSALAAASVFHGNKLAILIFIALSVSAQANSGFNGDKSIQSIRAEAHKVGGTTADYWLNNAEFELAGGREHFALLAIRRAVAESLTPDEQLRAQNMLANTCQHSQAANVTQQEMPLNPADWARGLSTSEPAELLGLLRRLEPVKAQSTATMHAVLSQRLAERYIAKREYDAAITQLRTVSQGTPYSLRAGHRLAQAYYLKGDRQAAIRTWLRLAQTSDEDLEALTARLYAANALVQENAQAQADQNYAQVLQRVQAHQAWLRQLTQASHVVQAAENSTPDQDQRRILLLFRGELASGAFQVPFSLWRELAAMQACLTQQEAHLAALSKLRQEKLALWRQLDATLATHQRDTESKLQRLAAAYEAASGPIRNTRAEDVRATPPAMSLNEKLAQLKAQQGGAANLQREPDLTRWDLTQYESADRRQQLAQAATQAEAYQHAQARLDEILAARRQLQDLQQQSAAHAAEIGRQLKTAQQHAARLQKANSDELQTHWLKMQQQKIQLLDDLERQARLGRLELLDRNRL